MPPHVPSHTGHSTVETPNLSSDFVLGKYKVTEYFLSSFVYSLFCCYSLFAENKNEIDNSIVVLHILYILHILCIALPIPLLLLYAYRRYIV
jgi:hypothetical protein